MTTSGLIVAGSRILASELQEIAPLAVIKDADQSVTSNATTQVNDNELFVPLVANATYLFACFIDFEGPNGNAAGISWSWTLPSVATLRYQPVFTNTTSGGLQAPMSTGSANHKADGSGAGGLEGISMDGSVICGPTAGNMQFVWCQGTSSGTVPAIVHAQSTLELWRIS